MIGGFIYAYNCRTYGTHAVFRNKSGDGKATQMDARGEHVIHLELGRPDFDTPQVIKEAAYKSLEKGNVFYTSNYGSMELRTAVAEKLRVENNIHYDPQKS